MLRCGGLAAKVSSMSIQPIETVYNGVRYRSRLEARWALFFDLLGVRHRYEEEAFALPSGNYLPDFRLPDAWATTGGCYVEVKPYATNDLRFCDFAALAPLIVVYGLPCAELRATVYLHAVTTGACFYRHYGRKGAWVWGSHGEPGEQVLDTDADGAGTLRCLFPEIEEAFAAVRAHRFWG